MVRTAELSAPTMQKQAYVAQAVDDKTIKNWTLSSTNWTPPTAQREKATEKEDTRQKGARQREKKRKEKKQKTKTKQTRRQDKTEGGRVRPFEAQLRRSAYGGVHAQTQIKVHTHTHTQIVKKDNQTK